MGYDYTVGIDEWQEENRRLSSALPALKGFCYYLEGDKVRIKLFWK